MYFHVPKINMKKDMCFQIKMYAAGMRARVGRTATTSEKWPGHDPIALPKRTESEKKRRSVWGHALELALQVEPQLRKLTIGKPPPRQSRDG